MNIERLELMATLMDELAANPPKKVTFDLDTWNCGTRACAVGFAMCDPRFNALGLHPVAEIGYDGKPSKSLMPAYANRTNSTAVEWFFDINVEEFEWLFTGEHYEADDIADFADGEIQHTPEMVADAIREFLKAGGIPG